MLTTYQKVIEERSIPEPNSGCWLWLGAITNGYGWYGERRGVTDRAHRLSWMAYRGPIPTGMYVCHRCDNRLCVNPEHLFLGTPTENNHDMMRKNRFRAPHTCGERHGHAKLSEQNVLDIFRSRERARDVAARYGLAERTVYGIRAGERWQHLTKAVNRDDT